MKQIYVKDTREATRFSNLSDGFAVIARSKPAHQLSGGAEGQFLFQSIEEGLLRPDKSGLAMTGWHTVLPEGGIEGTRECREEIASRRKCQ